MSDRNRLDDMHKASVEASSYLHANPNCQKSQVSPFKHKCAKYSASSGAEANFRQMGIESVRVLRHASPKSNWVREGHGRDHKMYVGNSVSSSSLTRLSQSIVRLLSWYSGLRTVVVTTEN